MAALLAFFKSTLKISLAVAIGCYLIRIPITEGESLFSMLTSLFTFSPCCCMLDTFNKNLTYKDFYYFLFQPGNNLYRVMDFSLLLYSLLVGY